MKYNITKRILSGVMAITFLISSSGIHPLNIMASSKTDTLATPNNNSSSSSNPTQPIQTQSTTVVEGRPESTTLEIDIPKRTDRLFAIRIKYNGAVKQDSKLEVPKEEISDILPEINYADIKEYDDGNPIDSQINIPDNINDYASKLSYLIHNNIISRNLSVLFSSNESLASNERYLRVKASSDKLDGVSNTDGKYLDPNKRISTTDFLTNLLKISKIEQSRVVSVHSKFKRTLESHNKDTPQYIDEENIKDSQYRNHLGELGLDSSQSDIKVNYNLGEISLYTSNDVPEYYILDALNKGIISIDDLGGIEGSALRKQIENNSLIGGAWDRNTPIRLRYNKLPKEYQQPQEILNGSKPDKIEYPDYKLPSNNTFPQNFWGMSYLTYNINPADPFSQFKTGQISKRPSYIEVNDGYVDPNKFKWGMQQDLGYQYLKTESLTLAQAYVYAYKFLKASDEDTKIPDKVVRAIISTYGMDFTTLNSEELQAVQYLIAKGIIDPDNQESLYMTSKYITNNEMVDLLYRIYNKDARYEVTANLSTTDEDMLAKGYYKNSIKFSGNSSRNTNVSATYLYADTNETWTEQMVVDRQANLSAYDYVYIRMPKNFNPSTNSYSLIGNDQYRVTIPAYNYYINGGLEITDETVNNVRKLLQNKESAYSTEDLNTGTLFKQNENKFVFFDGSQYWVRYIVPKNSSSSVIFKINIGDKYYTLNGIQGEGIYYLKDDNDIYGTLEKVGINTENNTTKRLIKVVVENDIEMRDELQRRVNQHNAINNLPTETTTQSSYTPKSIEEITTEMTTMSEKKKDVGLNSGSSGSKLFSSVKSVLNSPLFSFLFSPREVLANPNQEYFNQNDSQVDSSPIKASDQLGRIKIGPYTADNLLNLTFSGTPDVISGDASSGFVFNSEKMKDSIHYGTLKNVKIVSEVDNGETVYYLEYPTVESTIAFELSSFMQQLGLQSSVEGVTVPGYSQISSSTGERINLISETNFKSVFNIDVVSDKLLVNKTTGQKAFLNDTDSFTLIGNNITKYEASKMFVIDLGGEKHYNLDIILELVNDSNTLVNNIGKNTDVKTSNSYIFRTANIYNNNSIKSSGSANLIDKTYILHNKDNPSKTGVYVNLSALSSKVSNMLIFKDTTTEVPINMMVVYYPKDEDIENQNKVNNGLFQSTLDRKSVDMEKNKNRSNLVQLTDSQRATKVLSSYLFSAGGYVTNNDSLQTASSEVLPSEYQYDVYFLLKETSPGSGTAHQGSASAVFDTFVKKLQSINGSQSLLDNSLIDASLNNGKYGKSSNNSSNTNIRFSTLALANEVEVSPNNKSYFFLEEGTNNLYFRTTQPNEKRQLISNSEEYLKIFKNRLWFNPDTAKSDVAPEIRFRSPNYYTDTPKTATPLEAITVSNVAEITSTKGAGITELAPILQGSNQIKLFVKTSGTGDGNILVPMRDTKNKTSELALFTTIESDKYFSLDKLFETNPNSSSITNLDRYKYDKDQILGQLDGKLQRWLEDAYRQSYPNHEYSKGLNKFKPTISTFQAEYNSTSMNNSQIAQMFSGTWDRLLEFRNTENINQIRFPITALPKGFKEKEFTTLHLGNPVDANNLLESLKMKTTDLGIFITWSVNSIKNEIRIKSVLPFNEKDLQKGLKGLKGKNATLVNALYNIIGFKGQANTRTPIYVKGIFPTPAGTTVVTKDRNTEKGLLTTMISSSIRTKSNYLSDINNALLTRMMLMTNTLTFLSEVPTLSRVNLGSSTYSFIKTSNEQGKPNVSKRNTKSNMDWENLLLLPNETTEYDFTQATDYSVMYRLFTSGLFGYTIPLTTGAQDTKVTFSEVTGSGIWSFPDKELLEKVAPTLRTGTGTVDKNKTGFLFGNNKNKPIDVWGKSKDSEYSTLYEISKDNKTVKALDESKARQKTGFLLPILMMSPTLVVQFNNVANTYDIIGYIDPAYFNMDLKNSFVDYLEERNTPAYSPTQTLETVRGFDMNGDYFKKWENKRILFFTIESIMNFLMFGLPLLLTLYWVLVTILWCAHFIPVLALAFENFAELIGIDLVYKFTLGLLRSGEDARDNLYRWFKFSLILVTLIISMFRLLLLQLIVGLWQLLI